jgi:hypothetical protein
MLFGGISSTVGIVAVYDFKTCRISLAACWLIKIIPNISTGAKASKAVHDLFAISWFDNQKFGTLCCSVTGLRDMTHPVWLVDDKKKKAVELRHHGL